MTASPDQVRARYRRAGVAVYGVLSRRTAILEAVRELGSPETVAAWARLLDQWAESYREARRLWGQRLSDGSPSTGSRLAAAQLLEQTATAMREALEALRRRIAQVPVALRIARAAGLLPAIEALGAVSRGAAAAGRAAMGALSALPLLALAAILLLGGRRG